MGPSQNLSYLLHHLSMVVGKQSEEIVKDKLGIGLSQYRILAVLDWNPRIQQSAIATTLGQSEASISRQIKILEKLGMVKIEVDALNKRKHIAVPTTKGMQVTETATDLIRRNLGEEYGHMGEDQAAQLMNGLLSLHKVVCKSGKTGACNHPLGF